MKQYIPSDVCYAVSAYLDIESTAQFGRVSTTTKFLAKELNNHVQNVSKNKIQSIVSGICSIFTTLTTTYVRHSICRDILQNVNDSNLRNMIMNVVFMYYYEMVGNTYSNDFIEATLEKVEKGNSLTDIENNIWELYQQFWLGNDFYTSVFMSSNILECEVLLQTISNNQVNITILRPDYESISQDFYLKDVDNIVSFIWGLCGKKFFVNISEMSCKIVREYNVSKTPQSFDRIYQVYLALKEMQQPFYNVVEGLKKKIC